MFRKIKNCKNIFNLLYIYNGRGYSKTFPRSES